MKQIKRILLTLLLISYISAYTPVYASFDDEESEIWGNRNNNNNPPNNNNNGGGNGNGSGGNGQGNNGNGGGNTTDVPISPWPLLFTIPLAIWYVDVQQRKNKQIN